MLYSNVWVSKMAMMLGIIIEMLEVMEMWSIIIMMVMDIRGIIVHKYKHDVCLCFIILPLLFIFAD